MISEETRQALLMEIHKSLEEAASYAISTLGNANQVPTLSYPPNSTFTPEEKTAIKNLVLSNAAQSALKKFFWDVASIPIFDLFSLMDGVTDPENVDEIWLGATFSPKSEDDELMLHDELFESYWKYVKD